ncbi:MAG: hypothetical protein V4664_03405 [Patescibacteria group bacterium]
MAKTTHQQQSEQAFTARSQQPKGHVSNMSDTFILGQGPGHKLEKAVNRNGGNATDIEWLSTGQNFAIVMQLARGEATLTEKPKPVEPPLNTLIKVDRTVKPVYPDWVKDVLHPDLEANGPAEYDLANVDQWLHDKQKTGRIVGNDLYAHLQKEDMLKTCLTLRDGEEIRKNGIEAFRKFFKGKALFLWGSVVRRRGGSLRVPYLCDDGGGVVIFWDWLGSDWDDSNPAGRFES